MIFGREELGFIPVRSTHSLPFNYPMILLIFDCLSNDHYWTVLRASSKDIWDCSFSNGQFFIRDPNTRPGTLSFMTAYSVDESGAYELAILPDDSVGALADFLPVDNSSKTQCVKHEWITFN